ncbi:MAG: glycosyltransferase family 2 protein [Thermoplasmatota archaeon]
MDKLSILISSYNRPELIGLSIDSILNSNLPEGLELEIVIVDDQSDEETWEVLNEYKDDPRFIFHKNKRKSYAGGPNWSKGFEISTGNIILNNEDDMIWHKDFIKNLYTELKKHDRYTCCFGMYIQTPSLDMMRPPRSGPRNPYPKIGFFTGIPKKRSLRNDEHVSHNQFFCYRSFFDGLDEVWHHYPGSGLREETDLLLRLRKLKPERKFVAVPEAYLWHIENRSGKNVQDMKTRRKRDSTNHIIFLKRNFGWKALFMMTFYKLYQFQKSVRDFVGRNLIERNRERSS